MIAIEIEAVPDRRMQKIEKRIRYAVGDWLSDENPIAFCKKCCSWHEEPELVMEILSGENCETLADYRASIMFKLRSLYAEGVRWETVMELQNRYLPSCRLKDEGDEAYIVRMMSYAADPQWWPKLQMQHELWLGLGLWPVTRRENNNDRWVGIMGPKLWERAQRIKSKYPVNWPKKTAPKGG